MYNLKGINLLVISSESILLANFHFRILSDREEFFSDLYFVIAVIHAVFIFSAILILYFSVKRRFFTENQEIAALDGNKLNKDGKTVSIFISLVTGIVVSSRPDFRIAESVKEIIVIILVSLIITSITFAAFISFINWLAAQKDWMGKYGGRK